MTPEARAEYKKKSVEGGLPEGKAGPEHINAHWKVENGEIVNDARGSTSPLTRTTAISSCGSNTRRCRKATAVCYLRGIPQVQIWDSTQGDPRGLGQDKAPAASGTTARAPRQGPQQEDGQAFR